jgi:beta-N-acetylhexosaminidase
MVAGALVGAGCTPSTRPATTPAPRRSAVRPPRWAPGPLPAPDAPLTADQRRWVDETLASLTPRERVAQLVTVWVLGDYTNASDPTLEQVRQWVAEEGVGGVLMSLGSPIEVAAKVNYLQSLAKVPLLVSSDLEPGLGRLEGGVFAPNLMRGGSATVLPTAMAIAATGRDESALEAGRITGREARAIGIHLAFAPTADVNNNPANPVIAVRSFGEDPQAVARLTSAFVRGVQSEGTAATIKHFPGHGDTDTDSHNALPIVRSDRARLNEVELVPFREAIGAGVAAVMSAHIALPALEGDSTPATLAPRIMTGLLQDSLGFRGLVVTDALSMQGIGKGYNDERAAVLSLVAGSDVLDKPNDPKLAIDAVMNAIARGELTPERIDHSVRKVLALKARTQAAARPLVDLDSLRAIVAAPAHVAAAQRIAREAITLVRDSASLLPLRGRTAVVSYGSDVEVLAGRTLAAELQGALPGTRVVRIQPRTGKAELDSLAVSLAGFERVVVATATRTYEGEGRFALPPHIGAWIDTLATQRNVVVVASGNPYVIRQFPRVGTYLLTYGITEHLERAAAAALLGRAPITGRAPISLPGVFARGAGLTREQVAGVTR